ncbi:MAG: hypothetical protein JW924_05420 [Fusobacteriaceae bacterium]|nr:hypothetical protein [Fusobacteriaceae bacterium]
MEQLTFLQINLLRDGYKGIINGIIKLFIENENLIYSIKEKKVQLKKDESFIPVENLIYWELNDKFLKEKSLEKETFYITLSNIVNSPKIIKEVKDLVISDVEDLIKKRLIRNPKFNLIQNTKIAMILFVLIIEIWKFFLGMLNNKPVIILIFFFIYTLYLMTELLFKIGEFSLTEYGKENFKNFKNQHDDMKKNMGTKKYKENQGKDLYSALVGVTLPIINIENNYDNDSGSSCGSGCGSSCGSGCGSSCGGCGGCGDS